MKSMQSGIFVWPLVNSATTGTINISAVNTVKAVIIPHGSQGPSGTADMPPFQFELTSATQITVTLYGLNNNSYTSSWQVVEYL